MSVRLWGVRALAFLLLGWASPALAQSPQTRTLPFETGSAATTSSTVPIQTTEHFARAAGSSFSPANNPSTKSLTGPLSDVGNTLAEYGINIRAPIEEQFLNNVSEGSQPGTTGSGMWIIPTLTLDLGKLIGLKNGRIRFADEVNMLRIGDNANEGSFQWAANSGPLGTEKQNIKENTSLRQFSYEQLLLDNRLDFEIGRMNLKRYFWSPNCGIDSLTCLDLMLERNAGLPPSAFSTWTARAAYNITRKIYVQTGIEEINPHVNSTTGWAWSLHDSTGVFLPFEVAYKSDYVTTAYPGEYELGGWRVTTEHADPDVSSIERQGTSALQFWGDQVVWRQDGGATKNPNVRRINLFIQSGKSLDNTSVYSSQLAVGADLSSPFQSRPFDVYGIKVTNLKLTYDEQQFLAKQRKAAGGSDTFPTTSWYLEANAHFQLYRNVALETTAEYVINPDTIFNSKVIEARTGWVLGFTFIMDPARLLGIGG